MPASALRILIVEDHLLIARQLELIAASAGHEIVGTAATSEEACALAQTTDPDIVFLDVSLAGPSSGVDVAGFLAEQSRARVVFTTANRRRLPDDLCGAIGRRRKTIYPLGLALRVELYLSPDERRVRPSLRAGQSGALAGLFGALAILQPLNQAISAIQPGRSSSDASSRKPGWWRGASAASWAQISG